ETLSEIPDAISVFLKDITPNLGDQEFLDYFNKDGVREAITLFYEYTQETDKWDTEMITENLKKAIKEAKPQKKAFYMALRKILTDSFHGPDLVNTIYLIGRNRIIQRLERVVQV